MMDGDAGSRQPAPADRTTVVEDIVERLTRLVIDEGLKPGDQLLTERELMSRLAVGRSSLREAIKTLVALGVLEIRRGTGTFVSSGNTSMLTRPLAWGLFLAHSGIKEVIEARSSIEVTLAGWAAERANEAEVAEIAACLAALEESQGDRDSYVANDVAFHRAIARAAHNELLATVLAMLQHAIRVWMETSYVETGTSESMEQHRRIHAGIATRNIALAREAMMKHTNGGPLLAVATRNFPDEFPPINAFAGIGGDR